MQKLGLSFGILDINKYVSRVQPLKYMIFINNKYSKWYFSIIATAKSRAALSVYTELHHVIPKSLGGSNDSENLVSLSAKEHYICHRLLPRFLNGAHKKKMIYALYCITHVRNKGQHSRYIPNSNLYSKIKNDWQMSIKGRTAHNKGVPMSVEQKEKLRQANIGKTYTRSPEYLEKQSLAQKGKSRGKGRISNRKGIKMTDEQKEKIRQSMLGKNVGPRTVK